MRPTLEFAVECNRSNRHTQSDMQRTHSELRIESARQQMETGPIDVGERAEKRLSKEIRSASSDS